VAAARHRGFIVFSTAMAGRPLRRLPCGITPSRSLPRFGELRKHVYAQIQMAKQDWRPPAERKT
jgi:hypothetical protein